jgi:hypothetical protein
LIRPGALPCRKAAKPAVGPTRFVAPLDTVPPSGAAAVSFPAVPDPTGAVYSRP